MRLIVALAGCAALLLPGSSGAQDSDDLDRLNNAQLAAALYAELDDVFERLNPNGNYDLDDIFDAIMYALSDVGDDSGEQYVDMDDLEEEMEEAGLSLEDVVADSLQRADQVSDSGHGPILRVQRAGGARPAVAVNFTQQAIVQVVRKVHRP